jgi:DNA repair protein RecO (recombination protein O)
MSGRQRVYRTEAIVLRRLNLGEADRLLTLFTPEYGKIRVVAKGVRRPGSRKAGHLEPFTRSSVMLARGRELDIVTQAESLDLFPDLHQDLERLGQAAYMVELLDRFTVAEGESRGLYALLAEALGLLAGGAPSDSLVRYFELRLLDLVGYRPELFRCLGCGEEVRPQDQFFSANAGGVLCPACGRADNLAMPISLQALKVLRHFQRSPLKAALAPAVSRQVHAELEKVMLQYLTYQLERALNAPVFLDSVRALARPTVKPNPTSSNGGRTPS